MCSLHTGNLMFFLYSIGFHKMLSKSHLKFGNHWTKHTHHCCFIYLCLFSLPLWMSIRRSVHAKGKVAASQSVTVMPWQQSCTTCIIMLTFANRLSQQQTVTFSARNRFIGTNSLLLCAKLPSTQHPPVPRSSFGVCMMSFVWRFALLTLRADTCNNS